MLMSLLLSVLFSQDSYAWGPIGHRIVGEIAQHHLTFSSKQKLKKLTGSESLSDLANWADLIKSDPHFKHADTWHYVSIPDNMTYEQSTKNPKGDIIRAVQEQTAELKNPKASKEQKKQALAFLVHFIGDFHQPLHVGRVEDRGGNSIKLKWFERDSNLHEIWDEDLLKMEQLSYTEYVSFLYRNTKVSPADGKNLDLMVWVKECMNLRPLVYALPEEPKKYWEYEYRFKVRDALNLQLLRAGKRLGEWLNQHL